tara:strand:+ start:70437 stop:71915 length:1479 start_codon:yes stop_codon:yes gene_type:complete
MVSYFLAGVALGALFMGFLFLSARREIVIIDEEKQHLQQEKQIVVEFMHTLVEGIGESMDRNELFDRIVHAAALSTGALSACIFERTEDSKLRSAAIEGLFPPQRSLPEDQDASTRTRSKFIEDVLRSQVFEMSEGLIGSVAKSGKAVLIEDAREDPRVVQHKDVSLQVRSLIAVPISFRDEVLGVLAVANPSDGTSFNESDLSLVQSLGEQAGMAIHSSDLLAFQIEKSKIEIDLTLASNIQGMLLPKTFPENPSLDIDACYHPAQKVGGDLYDAFALGPNKVGIAIADVSGKGIAASLVMAICQANLRHFARQYDSPAEVLRALNRAMSEQINRDMFITIAYAIVDTAKNQITIARAGHELPLLFRYQNTPGKLEAERIGSEGMALGMVPGDIFDSIIIDRVIDFGPNDIMVLYTDGVTETVDHSGEEFSEERLATAVEDFTERPSAGINQGILAGLEAFAGSEQLNDDLTLITVKHVGMSGSSEASHCA